MSSTAPRLAVGSIFEDRYEIRGELGTGSFARIYEAIQISTGQSVAIKLPFPEALRGGGDDSGVERFRREAQIVAELSHPNIVQLIDSGERSDGQQYVVFAHVRGETFEQALARHGPFEVRECVRLMTQVLEALAVAHAKGFVHRDLKPGNLMLSEGARRTALVLDFGLGGLAERQRSSSLWRRMTQTGEFLGTPLYASPEQLTGGVATARSDLYAWGLVFLECLSGEHPLAEDGALARMLGGEGGIEIPSWLAEHRLGEVLARATQRDEARRDVSAGALIDELDAIERASELPVLPSRAKRGEALPDAGWERRRLTVLCADLDGAARLSRKLGADLWRDTLREHEQRCAAMIERYGGQLIEPLGRGLRAYFGYPLTHEDAVERAVRAGSGMLREVEALALGIEARHGLRPELRVGIHTDSMSVHGGDPGQSARVLGDAPKIAAQLREVATPGTLVISDATLRLIPGLCVVEECRAIEGEDGAALRTHTVTRLEDASILENPAPAQTPFVGRVEELGLLRARWEQVIEGHGQAVWISGEPGIGKSRLVRQLREQLLGDSHRWLQCSGSPYTTNSALHPVIELVEQGLRLADADKESRVEQLEAALQLERFELDEVAPLFASLLSMRLPDRYEPLDVSPQLQRQRTLEAVLEWVLTQSERHPVVVVVEDLQWADPSTLEWLGLLIEQCATSRVLLLLTSRPEFELRWPNREHLLPIPLNRLSAPHARALVRAAIADQEPADALIEQIAARSDGVPLFVEEIAKGVEDAGGDLSGSLSGLQIPDSLQDSLMARLDRLGDAKGVAQMAAALGREFSYALLEAVAPDDDATLRNRLATLVAAELLYQRGIPPKSSYTFKHGLVQDAAYQSLLESQRQELHGRVVDALEERFPDLVEHAPELMARHCEETGRVRDALDHYHRAGQRAVQRSAHAEAIAHLTKALGMLSTLPEDEARDLREIELRLALGDPLAAERGYEHPDAVQSCRRVESLCDAIEAGPKQLQGLLGLALYHVNCGDLPRARSYARALLAVAEPIGVTPLCVAGHMMMGSTGLTTAVVPEACEHLEKAIEIASADPSLGSSGVDPLVLAHCFHAIGLAVAGRPESAVLAADRGIARARERADPRTCGSALANAAMAFHFLDEPERVAALSAESLEAIDGRGFRTVEVSGWVLGGWARARQGDPDGIEDLERGLALALECGTAGGLAQYYLAAVDVYGRAGRWDDAYKALEQAGTAMERTGEYMAYRPQIPAIRAKLMLDSGDEARDEAVALLLQAMDLGESNQAPWLILAPAIELSHLALRSGEGRELAGTRLHAAYARFVEGFDHPRLVEARSLMEQLPVLGGAAPA